MRVTDWQVVVTLSETAPASVRKAGAAVVPVVVAQALKMMTDLEDDDEWATSDDLTEEVYPPRRFDVIVLVKPDKTR